MIVLNPYRMFVFILIILKNYSGTNIIKKYQCYNIGSINKKYCNNADKKRSDMKEVQRIQGRWFPLAIIYKDVLKEGKGTEFRITTIKFDQQIPQYIFTKASLR